MSTETALPASPASAPRGFTAQDRCPTCGGCGKWIAPALAADGEYVLDADGNEVEALVDCDDCDGVGWSKPVAGPTSAQRFARRVAEHAEFVAEFGPGASCGGAWCRCPGE